MTLEIQYNQELKGENQHGKQECERYLLINKDKLGILELTRHTPVIFSWAESSVIMTQLKDGTTRTAELKLVIVAPPLQQLPQLLAPSHESRPPPLAASATKDALRSCSSSSCHPLGEDRTAP